MLSQARYGPVRGLGRILDMVTYTMHPEAIGRGYCLRMLERVVAAMQDRGQVWFATHGEIAGLAGPGKP
jgi:hypothetical protein